MTDDVEVVEAEVVDPAELPNSNGTALAVIDENDDGHKVAAQVQHMVDKMKLQWEQEKKEHEKWKKEDIVDNARYRLAAMMAAALIGDGAAGVRMRTDQIAAAAVEYADAILAELKKKTVSP